MPVNLNPIPRDLLSIADTAVRTETSRETVRRWVTQPNDPLPHYRIGGRIRISESELVERFPGPWRDRPAA